MVPSRQWSERDGPGTRRQGWHTLFRLSELRLLFLLTTAVLVELHLQRDPPQVASFLHQLERSGYSLHFVNYDGDLVPTGAETILDNPQEHWTLRLVR